MITNLVAICIFFHTGTLQHFQKSKLQLIRLHAIDIIEGLLKTFQILIRKSCNQIQMLMNISKTFYAADHFRQFRKIHSAVNRFHRLRIGGLYSDLQLNESRTHLFHNGQFFFCRNIRCNLKVKIGHSIVMFLNPVQ